MHIVLHPSSHNQPLRLEAFCVLSFCWNLQNDRRLLMSRIFHFSYYVFGVNYFTFCRQRGQCAPKKQTAPCCAASNFSGLETKVPSYPPLTHPLTLSWMRAISCRVLWHFYIGVEFIAAHCGGTPPPHPHLTFASHSTHNLCHICIAHYVSLQMG